MITSVHNPKIKRIRQLQESGRERRQEGVFVIEGVRLAEEALASGWPVRWALYDSAWRARGRAGRDGRRQAGAEVEEASENVLRSAAETGTPQGLLALLEMRPLPPPERLDFVLIADDIHDPGNLGTILRSAAAAGVQCVCLPPGGADPWAPKVVRSGMGAHFRLPLMAMEWPEIECLALQQRLQVWLAAAEEGIDCFAAGFRSPTALIIGGEAAGAGAEAQRLATGRVHIPMPGKTESLNAAVAASILLFEVVRQRRR